MRIQVRVTPAYQELHDHLESFDSEYRGKRLLALAAMQLAALGRNGVSDAPLQSTPAMPQQEVAATVETVTKSEPKSARKSAPSWITSSKVKA